MGEVERLRAALRRIERWHGEFPRVPDRNDPSETIPYAIAYGSNGERDFMRQIAREALAQPATEGGVEACWRCDGTRLVYNDLDECLEDCPSCKPTPPVEGSSQAGEREAIERAIRVTEYKYFGDYEMSDDQREAVDQLVLTAQHYLAALARPQVHIGANGQPVEHLNIAGREQEVDVEIAPIVRALNAAGIETVASCSGHGVRLGNIALRDGRELLIASDHEEARRVENLLAKPQVPDVGMEERARELLAVTVADESAWLAAHIRKGDFDDQPNVGVCTAIRAIALSAQSTK